MKKIVLFLSLLSSTLVAYSDNQTSQKDLDTVRTPKLIVTSFYPLAFMTEQIVGEKAQVINMAGSVDVHVYEPSPQDLVKLNKADLVIFQGAELEPWTDGVIPELKTKGVPAIEVSHSLDLAKTEEHDDHKKHKDEHEKPADEHHAAEKSNKKEKHKDEHGEHHHGEFDPHTWLDPVLAQKMVNTILKAVVAIDSANETSYQANAQVLKDRFAQLDKAFQTGLAQCANEELIISHDAYGYLSRRYGFHAHTITGFSPHDEPSAKILAALKEEAEEGISHILIEENNIRRFADTLARETGLETLPANPLGRGTLNPQKDFFDVMQENLNSFKTALNCQK